VVGTRVPIGYMPSTLGTADVSIGDGAAVRWSISIEDWGLGDPTYRALAAALLFGEMTNGPWRPDLILDEHTGEPNPWRNMFRGLNRDGRVTLSRELDDLRSTSRYGFDINTALGSSRRTSDLNTLVGTALRPFLQERVTPQTVNRIRAAVESELRTVLPDGARPVVHVEQDERDPSRLTVRVEWRDEPRWRLHRAEVSAFLPGAMPPR
jgi:hypothetical protein